jgi:sodium/bile acid cotransporter 7
MSAVQTLSDEEAPGTEDNKEYVEPNEESSEDDLSVAFIPGELTEHTHPVETTGQGKFSKVFSSLLHHMRENEFLILILLAIGIAKAYPPLGAEYLKPTITAGWVAVIIIFFLSGLSLRFGELTSSMKNMKVNLYIQIYNFGLVSALVFGFSQLMKTVGALEQPLADGMTICGSLPISVNAMIILTKAAHGDEASSIFNTVVSNFMGVFLTPLLIVGYLGKSGGVDLPATYIKLIIQVLVPLAVGQITQKMCKPVVKFFKRHPHIAKRGQEWSLVFIVYTVFCKTFSTEPVSTLGEIFLMILFQLVLLLVTMTLAWFSLSCMTHDAPKTRVMGLFGCTHKTIGLGVPLINSLYGENALVGTYTLPLLIWYPLQVILGSLLLKRLQNYIATDMERLALLEEREDHKAQSEETKAGSDESNKEEEDLDVDEQGEEAKAL